jgi:NTP pyrophosphatase (non-canonical NTP hydrolase)
MSKYEPKTTAEKLGWVIEECGELLAAVGKTQRHGLDSWDPTDGAKRTATGDRELNVDWVLREMLDVEKAIRLARTAIICDAEESDPPRVDPAVREREIDRLTAERDAQRTRAEANYANVLAMRAERDEARREIAHLRNGFRATLFGTLEVAEELLKKLGGDHAAKQRIDELRQALDTP